MLLLSTFMKLGAVQFLCCSFFGDTDSSCALFFDRHMVPYDQPEAALVGLVLILTLSDLSFCRVGSYHTLDN